MRQEIDIDQLMAETWLTVTMLKKGAVTRRILDSVRLHAGGTGRAFTEIYECRASGRAGCFTAFSGPACSGSSWGDAEQSATPGNDGFNA